MAASAVPARLGRGAAASGARAAAARFCALPLAVAVAAAGCAAARQPPPLPQPTVAGPAAAPVAAPASRGGKRAGKRIKEPAAPAAGGEGAGPVAGPPTVAAEDAARRTAAAGQAAAGPAGVGPAGCVAASVRAAGGAAFGGALAAFGSANIGGAFGAGGLGGASAAAFAAAFAAASAGATTGFHYGGRFPRLWRLPSGHQSEYFALGFGVADKKVALALVRGAGFSQLRDAACGRHVVGAFGHSARLETPQLRLGVRRLVELALLLREAYLADPAAAWNYSWAEDARPALAAFVGSAGLSAAAVARLHRGWHAALAALFASHADDDNTPQFAHDMDSTLVENRRGRKQLCFLMHGFVCILPRAGDEGGEGCGGAGGGVAAADAGGAVAAVAAGSAGGSVAGSATRAVDPPRSATSILPAPPILQSLTVLRAEFERAVLRSPGPVYEEISLSELPGACVHCAEAFRDTAFRLLQVAGGRSVFFLSAVRDVVIPFSRNSAGGGASGAARGLNGCDADDGGRGDGGGDDSGSDGDGGGVGGGPQSPPLFRSVPADGYAMRGTLAVHSAVVLLTWTVLRCTSATALSAALALAAATAAGGGGGQGGDGRGGSGRCGYIGCSSVNGDVTAGGVQNVRDGLQAKPAPAKPAEPLPPPAQPPPAAAAGPPPAGPPDSPAAGASFSAAGSSLWRSCALLFLASDPIFPLLSPAELAALSAAFELVLYGLRACGRSHSWPSPALPPNRKYRLDLASRSFRLNPDFRRVSGERAAEIPKPPQPPPPVTGAPRAPLAQLTVPAPGCGGADALPPAGADVARNAQRAPPDFAAAGGRARRGPKRKSAFPIRVPPPKTSRRPAHAEGSWDDPWADG